MVGSLHHFRWLYVYSASRGALIVDYAGDRTLVGGRDGNHEASVAERRGDILVDGPAADSGIEHATHGALY